jgi:hypothetical protein
MKGMKEMRNVNEEMKDLLSRLSLCLFAFLLFSCMDMDDTTPPVKTTIQLVMPAEFVNMTDLSGMTVTLQSSIETVTAMSDSVGGVSLTELAPNTYDITVSVSISHEQYEQYTGQTAGGNSDFMLSGTLNQQVIIEDGGAPDIDVGDEPEEPSEGEQFGSPAECSITLPKLEIGDKWGYVYAAQALLIAHGYDCGNKPLFGIEKADGEFGRATERSVGFFQSKHGLEVDGIIGGATWAALLKF